MRYATEGLKKLKEENPPVCCESPSMITGALSRNAETPQNGRLKVHGKTLMVTTSIL
jgi:hypothetical protein